MIIDNGDTVRIVIFEDVCHVIEDFVITKREARELRDDLNSEELSD